MATAALALTGEYDNMCTMGLAMGKDIKTDCSINGQIGGKTYCFGSQEAKTEFMKAPEANLAKAQAYYSKKKGRATAEGDDLPRLRRGLCASRGAEGGKGRDLTVQAPFRLCNECRLLTPMLTV
jgi:YHS domain-containing protein